MKNIFQGEKNQDLVEVVTSFPGSLSYRDGREKNLGTRLVFN